LSSTQPNFGLANDLTQSHPPKSNWKDEQPFHQLILDVPGCFQGPIHWKMPDLRLNGICSDFFFEKKCFDPQFLSSVANKVVADIVLSQTYCYVWLNNCGLGRPSWMRVFKRLHMKPLHHIHIHRGRFMYMNHNKHTYQATHHHKCTAYQHLCRFMHVNREQTYQLSYHHKS
jgi:hypothetical protein